MINNIFKFLNRVRRVFKFIYFYYFDYRARVNEFYEKFDKYGIGSMKKSNIKFKDIK